MEFNNKKENNNIEMICTKKLKIINKIKIRTLILILVEPDKSRYVVFVRDIRNGHSPSISVKFNKILKIADY